MAFVNVSFPPVSTPFILASSKLSKGKGHINASISVNGVEGTTNCILLDFEGVTNIKEFQVRFKKKK